MYQPGRPCLMLRYPHTIRRRRLSPKEILWRLAWPFVLTLVLATVMLILTATIFALDIASLAVDSSNKLSNTASTGAGIWCSVIFVFAAILMYLLVLAYHSSRLWSTYCLLANILVLIFAIVLVSLDANAVSPYNALSSTAPTKIQILKAQLAMAILMLVLPFCFFAIYIYTAFASLRTLRAPNRSVYPPYPVLPQINKY